MKKQWAFVLATSLATVVWSAGASANLVQNGSFENLKGSQTLTNTYFEAVSSGSNRIKNWKVSAASGKSVDSVREGTVASALDWAQDGQYAIDMAGTPGPGKITQKIKGADDGQAYLLSFWTSSNGTAGKTMDVLWNGVKQGATIVTAFAQGTWVQHQFTVYGTAGVETLRFKGLTSGTNGVLLDNVSLTAVPLPPAIILFGSVLFGFATMARKRRAGESALAA